MSMGGAYSCLVLPRRVVFSFCEVTVWLLARRSRNACKQQQSRQRKEDNQKLELSQHRCFQIGITVI